MRSARVAFPMFSACETAMLTKQKTVRASDGSSMNIVTPTASNSCKLTTSLAPLTKRLLFACCLALFATTAAADESTKQLNAQAIHKGKQFLVDLYDDEMELLPEFRGHNVYWLFHDNYLAAKVLSNSHPKVAKKIRDAIKRFDVHRAGKIEILFGEAKEPLPFRHHLLKDVATRDGKVVRTEVVTDRELQGWRKYADLLLLSAIHLSKSHPKQAKRDFDTAMAMWDGKGFNDAVVKAHGRYATYKLALAAIAAKRLGVQKDLPDKAIPTLRRLQDKSGGWITDYKSNGEPIGKANVETSCLAIIALGS